MEFELGGKRPKVHPDAYIAPTAVLIGDVEVESGASVWFGAVLRADEAQIRIGEGSNIQDNVVIHCSRNLPTVVGTDVTIGHQACLEGCTVEDGAVVGTGAIMLQRSRLGAGAMLAAGLLLRSFVAILAVDPGLKVQNVLTVRGLPCTAIHSADTARPASGLVTRSVLSSRPARRQRQ